MIWFTSNFKLTMKHPTFMKFRRKIYDDYNDEEVELTKEEIKTIRRMLKGKAPHADFDPYAVCTLSPNDKPFLCSLLLKLQFHLKQ